MRKISFLYPKDFKVVTGGHRYEYELFQDLKNNPEFVVEKDFLYNFSDNKLKKIFSPLLSLGRINKLKHKDIIVFNSTKGFYYYFLSLFLTKLYKKKTVIIHHHFLNEEFYGVKKFCYKLMEIAFLKSSKYIITPSPYIKDQIKKQVNKDSILCPIPFNQPENICQQANVIQSQERDIVELLYVGTIEPRKGLKYLFEALIPLTQKKLNYRLNIVGKVKNQRYYDELVKIMSESKINVKFHGFLSNDQLIQLYINSEIFVFPSLLEGFGMSVNEAMSFGLPVVCFDNSALPYSVNNSRGRIVKNKDIQELSFAIEELILNKELRKNLGDNSLDYAKNLPNHENFKNKILETFSNL